MKKTLAEIMSEPANVEQIIRTASAINKLIEDSRKAGVVWPDISEDHCQLETSERFTECHFWKLAKHGCDDCIFSEKNRKRDANR